jgi:hypothetical protein
MQPPLDQAEFIASISPVNRPQAKLDPYREFLIGHVVMETDLAVVPEDLTRRQARTSAIAMLEAATQAEDKRPRPVPSCSG